MRLQFNEWNKYNQERNKVYDYVYMEVTLCHIVVEFILWSNLFFDRIHSFIMTEFILKKWNCLGPSKLCYGILYMQFWARILRKSLYMQISLHTLHRFDLTLERKKMELIPHVISPVHFTTCGFKSTVLNYQRTHKH